MTDDEFKAAFLKRFGADFLPKLTSVIDTAHCAIAHATALELRVAALEQLLSTSALSKSLDKIAARIVEELKPNVDRVLHIAEQTFARNAALESRGTLQ